MDIDGYYDDDNDENVMMLLVMRIIDYDEDVRSELCTVTNELALL